VRASHPRVFGRDRVISLLLIRFRPIVIRSGRVLNLLSEGAADRVLVAVFQNGGGFSSVRDSCARATTSFP
jgi:hypothetical protein